MQERTRPALPRGRTALWLAAVLATAFWQVRADLEAAMGDALGPASLTGGAMTALVLRTAGHALEAAFYTSAWGALGRRVGFGWMFVVVTSLSSLDVLANALVRLTGGDAPWLAPLVGARALPGAFEDSPALAVAFGGVGLLALVRVYATAAAQRAEGAPAGAAFALTATAWLAGRVATWWTTDLVRGFGAAG